MCMWIYAFQCVYVCVFVSTGISIFSPERFLSSSPIQLQKITKAKYYCYLMCICVCVCVQYIRICVCHMQYTTKFKHRKFGIRLLGAEWRNNYVNEKILLAILKTINMQCQGLYCVVLCTSVSFWLLYFVKIVTVQNFWLYYTHTILYSSPQLRLSSYIRVQNIHILNVFL